MLAGNDVSHRYNYYWRYNQRNQNDSSLEGRLFDSFSMVKNLEQWIPEINTLITLGKGESDEISKLFPKQCSSAEIDAFVNKLDINSCVFKCSTHDNKG